jgi:ABC-type bacteriocin/lantibiotic exporter with double-glycine peptidase domain
MTKARFATRALLGLMALVTAPVLAIVCMAALPPKVEQGARVRAWLMDADYLGATGVRLQQNGTDCAVAALEMLVDGLGHDTRPLASWRDTVQRRGEGMTLLEMQRAAATVGVSTYGIRATLTGLRRVPLPAIVHFDHHFVVLDRIDDGDTYQLRDPASGRMRMGAAAFREAFTGEVLAVAPIHPSGVATP